MEMKNNYQNTEAKAFVEKFEGFREKKIVLYGIGRFTATLLPCIRDFHIVGLMDRDSANIGKLIYGVPVISKEEAKEKADLIIINTSPNYWKVIYARIADLGVPVYYLNGELACREEESKDYIKNPYWEKTYESLQKEIQKYEVISFDIFDTLVMRKIYMPQDIYKIADMRVKEKLGASIDYYETRIEAELENREKELLLDDIYRSMNEKWAFSEDVLQQIKEVELQVEQQFLTPRKDMVRLYNETVRTKEVHLISDMYLPKDAVCRILKNCGVDRIPSVFISGEEKVNKKQGLLWKKYADTVVRGRSALHIGDNYFSDVQMPEKYGICGWHVMSGGEMLKNSSLQDFVPRIENLDESLFMGVVIAELFNSPFALSESKGKVVISNFEKMGYCIWGGIIYAFLAWMIEQAKAMGIEHIVFFARDGYFLERDYKYLTSLLREDTFPETRYLPISRRLILIASYKETEGIDKIAGHVYNGTFADYMEDRFDIVIDHEAPHYSEEINLPEDYEKVRSWLSVYEEAILSEIQTEKENYLNYIHAIGIDEKHAIVDLWYYGNNQYYLSQTIGKSLTGFYFAVNNAETNKCRENNTMIACFQEPEDPLAEKVHLYHSSLLVESFLTAPYGMIKAVDKNGNFICNKGGMNQALFSERETINDGVCRFLKEYTILTDKKPERLNPQFADAFFGEIAKEHIEFTKEIKDIFYFDNAIVRRRELKIFE